MKLNKMITIVDEEKFLKIHNIGVKFKNERHAKPYKDRLDMYHKAKNSQ